MVWKFKNRQEQAADFRRAVEAGLLAKKGPGYIFLRNNPDVRALVTGTAGPEAKTPELLSFLKKAVEMIENPAAVPLPEDKLSDQENLEILQAAGKKTGFIVKPKR